MFPYIPTLIPVPDQLCPLRGLREVLEVLVPHARVQTPRLVYADLDHRVHISLDTFLDCDGIFLGRDGIFSLGLLTILRDLGVPPVTMLALFCHLVRTNSGEHTPCSTRGV
jgi:hypothetical protein